MVGFTSILPSKFVELFQEAMDYARGLEAENQRLKDEIARLKQVPEKPEVKKSKGKDDDCPPGSGGGGKRGGSRAERRRQKKAGIQIHETIVIKPQGLPPDARLLDE